MFFRKPKPVALQPREPHSSLPLLEQHLSRLNKAVDQAIEKAKALEMEAEDLRQQTDNKLSVLYEAKREQEKISEAYQLAAMTFSEDIVKQQNVSNQIEEELGKLSLDLKPTVPAPE